MAESTREREQQHGVVRGMVALLEALGSAVSMAVGQQGRNQNGNASHSERDLVEDLDLVLEPDRYTEYSEELVDGSRVVRNFENGSVRLENTVSGVIQEERKDGSLVVSLPTGRVLFQQFAGEPLLVYDTESETPPRLAQVGYVHLPGNQEETVAYYFQEDDVSHLIELETLRYFRLTRGF